MRLIDADKLHLTYVQGTYVGGGIYVGNGCIFEYDEVVNAPTIDAIPIKWIKDYIDFGVSDKLAQHDMRFVSKMIEDWEKENETN